LVIFLGLMSVGAWAIYEWTPLDMSETLALGFCEFLALGLVLAWWFEDDSSDEQAVDRRSGGIATLGIAAVVAVVLLTFVLLTPFQGGSGQSTRAGAQTEGVGKLVDKIEECIKRHPVKACERRFLGGGRKTTDKAAGLRE
jgi:hypothetical protein